MAGLVAHHVAEQLLQQGLARELVQVSERGQRETLDHHLHAEVSHVPPAVVDDVVEEHAQVGVDLESTTQFLVEVAGEDFDVTGLVDHLGRGVQLRVVPRHGLGDLGGAEKRTLLTVHELREAPLALQNRELGPLLVAPLLDGRAVVVAGGETRHGRGEVGRNLGLDVDVGVPGQVGGGVPLTGLGLLI